MGVGIVLFVIGAILEFALRIDVTWIDVHLVGYILMIAGAVVFLLSLILLLVRRSRRTGPVNDEELL
jgi:predicted membrane protein